MGKAADYFRYQTYKIKQNMISMIRCDIYILKFKSRKKHLGVQTCSMHCRVWKYNGNHSIIAVAAPLVSGRIEKLLGEPANFKIQIQI